MTGTLLRIAILLTLGAITGFLVGHEWARQRSGPPALADVAPSPAPVVLPRFVAPAEKAPEAAAGWLAEAAPARPHSREPGEAIALDDAVHALSLEDPERAVLEALRLGAELDTLGRSFARLAVVDAETAFDLWRTQVTGNRAQRGVALALLAALGGDRGAFERVRAELPDTLPDAIFVSDAIVHLLRRDGDEALAITLEIDDQELRQRAAYRLAWAWGSEAPREALARVDRLQRGHEWFESAIVDAWSRVDPAAALAWLDEGVGHLRPQQRERLRMALESRTDPEAGFFAMLEQGSRTAGYRRGEALGRIASTDPERAWELLQAHAAPGERDQWLQMLGASVERRDPAAALAWIEQRGEGVAGTDQLLLGLLRSTGDVDVLLDVFERIEGDAARSQGIGHLIQIGIPAGRTSELVALAEGLDGTDVGAHAFNQLGATWGATDADAAVRWLATNSGPRAQAFAQGLQQGLQNATPAEIERLARGLGPDKARPMLLGAAQVLAQRDPGAAVALLERQSLLDGSPNGGQLYYIFERWADVAPRQAAQRALRLTEGPTRNMVLGAVAQGWASQDRPAALRWIERLGDEAPPAAVASVVSRWSSDDRRAARRYALSRPSGAFRDALLAPMLTRPSTDGSGFEIDDDLLDAYSSDEKRQDVLMTMLPALHRSAPERVDELLARYVTDPARRAAIEAQIRVQGGGLFTSGR